VTFPLYGPPLFCLTVPPSTETPPLLLTEAEGTKDVGLKMETAPSGPLGHPCGRQLSWLLLFLTPPERYQLPYIFVPLVRKMEMSDL